MEEEAKRHKDMGLGFSNNDLLITILSRVPAKSLLRFKLLSKEWDGIISDYSFMSSHSLSSKVTVSGLFFQEKFHWSKEDIDTVSYIPVDTEYTFVEFSALEFLPEKVVLMASNNGLICCRSCSSSRNSLIYICNPANKEWVHVNFPGPEKPQSLALAFDLLRNPTGFFGNFRLVHVQEIEIDEEIDVGADDHWEIYYSFEIYYSEKGEWVKVDDICHCDRKFFKNEGVYADRIFYWLTEGDQIVTFDLRNEKSRVIGVPSAPTSHNNICIGESNGVLHYIEISGSGIVVWMLEDHFQEKWKIIYSVSLEEMQEKNSEFLFNVVARMTERTIPWVELMAFKDGLLFFRWCSTIYFYPLDSGKMVNICDRRTLGQKSVISHTALPYNMSLVPVRY